MRGKVIEQIKWYYATYGEIACNSIIEEIADKYEDEALSSKNFLQNIKNSPLFWETNIKWYSTNTRAPLQLFSLYYNKEENVIYGGVASNFLTGPPDPHEFYIDAIPDQILIFILHQLQENIKL